MKLSAMSDDNHSFTVLWHAIIHSIYQANLDNIIQRLQSLENLIKIPTVAIKNPSHIFKNPDLRLNLLHSGNKNGKSVSGIIQSHLVSTNAERLARRATDDNVRLGKECFCCQRDLFAITLEISPISFAGIVILFEAKGFKSLRLKAQRQPATTGK